MQEVTALSSENRKGDLDEQSAFQSLLGSKLGALACELIYDHNNSIVVQQRRELEQLHSEAVELRRKLAKLEYERDLPRSDKLNLGAENVDIDVLQGEEVALGAEKVKLDFIDARAESVAQQRTPVETDFDVDGADPKKRQQSPVNNRQPENCIGLDNTLSFTVPAAGSPTLSGSLTSARRLLGECGTSASPEKLKVKDCVDQRFQIHRGKAVQGQASVRDPDADFDATAEQMDVMHCFEQLDATGHGYIDIEDLLEVCYENIKGDLDDEQLMIAMDEHRSSLYRLNRVLGALAHEPHAKKSGGHLNLAAFKMLMLADPQDLEDVLHDAKLVKILLDIRSTVVNSSVISAVAKAMHVSQSAVLTWQAWRRSWIEKWMEPVVALMIILNSLMIGVSLDTDPGWQGWQYFEAYFTIFLVLELTLCLCVYGGREHFFGKDWAWNLFDFVLVVLAVIDTTWTSLSKLFGSDIKSIDLNKITVLRLARLARVTRIIRLIRLGMFKELALMINGVIEGFRTLMWAMVLLSVLVYNLGVVMREAMDIQGILSDCKDTTQLNGKVFNLIDGAAASESTSCSPGDFVMARYRGALFGNVGRSMLTVFNCFTDGCDLPDGTPLVWYLWDTHGGLMILGYVFAYLFVCFGVFNLVAAVFVENTMERALQRRQERHFLHAGHVAHAHHLHHLLHKVCRERYKGGMAKSSKLSADVKQMRCMDYLKMKLGRTQVMSFAKSDDFQSTHLQMRVSQAMFDELLKDDSVQHILDELEISVASREQLFSILDSDGNGYLAISELVEGLMRLRGPFDKGDLVSTELMVRALQWQMRKFEAYVMDNQKQLKATTQDIKMMMGHIQGDTEHLEGPTMPSAKMSL